MENETSATRHPIWIVVRSLDKHEELMKSPALIELLRRYNPEGKPFAFNVNIEVYPGLPASKGIVIYSDDSVEVIDL